MHILTKKFRKPDLWEIGKATLTNQRAVISNGYKFFNGYKIWAV